MEIKLKNIKRESSRIFRNKKVSFKQAVKTNKKNNFTGSHRGINEFKQVGQPTINFVKDENTAILTDYRNSENVYIAKY
jgi:hypothetical protein